MSPECRKAEEYRQALVAAYEVHRRSLSGIWTGPHLTFEAGTKWQAEQDAETIADLRKELVELKRECKEWSDWQHADQVHIEGADE